MSRDYHFEQSVYEDSQIKNLELSTTKLQEQFRHSTNLAGKYKSEASKNLDELRNVAMVVCDNAYSMGQLGGRNEMLKLDAFELKNFIIENHQKQREEVLALMLELQNQLHHLQQQNEDKDRQLADLLRQRAETEQRAYQNQYSQQHHAPPQSPLSQYANPHNQGAVHQQMQQPPQQQSPMQMAPSQQRQMPIQQQPQSRAPQAQSQQQQIQPPQSPAGNYAPQTHTMLIDSVENTISDIGWNILVAIGANGLSEGIEIENQLTGTYNSSNVKNAFATLQQSQIIESDKVNTGNRWFYAWNLTDLGVQIYQRKFRKPPVQCEKHMLRAENATWDHGYTIKDTATLLEDMGMIEIKYRRRENEIQLSGGRMWIPDVVCYDTISKQKLYVEVELGHHTQADFDEKIDKARQITKDLRFVTQNKDQAEKIIKQYSAWKLSKSQSGTPVKNFDVWITTTSKLAKKDWGNTYPS